MVARGAARVVGRRSELRGEGQTGRRGAARACVDAAADEDRATPAKVLALLADAFPSPAASASALDRLLDLRMGRMSVNEYAAHFKLAVHQYNKDMKDAELVSFFLRGLLV